MWLPENDEYVGKVVEFLGGGKVKVEKKDGLCTICRITGRLKAKQIQIEHNDHVLIRPWDFEPEKGDIVWRYKHTELGVLQKRGLI